MDIRYPSKSLARAVVVDNSGTTHERVYFGATVTILSASGDELDSSASAWLRRDKNPDNLPCPDDRLLHGVFCVEGGAEHAIAVAEQRRALSFDLADVDGAAGHHTMILAPHLVVRPRSVPDTNAPRAL